MKLIINIDVDDLEKATAFYRDALGLRFSRFLFEGSVAEMVGTTSLIQLSLKPVGSTAAIGADAKRVYARHWTPLHIDFQVDNIYAAVERALKAGALLETDISTHAWGMLATLSDPFGHGFCFVQLSEQGYDAVEGTSFVPKE